MKNNYLLLVLLLAFLIPGKVNAQDTFSYEESFETYSANNMLPTGWTKVISGTTAGVTNANGQVHNGTKSFGFSYAKKFGTDYYNIVALPYYEVEPGSVTISFWSKAQSNHPNCGTFDVGYITDVNDVNTFKSVANYSYSSFTNYTKVTLQLASMPQNARIAFRHHPNYINYKWYIDDITVTASLLCCPTPQVLSPVLTPGNGSIAMLSWNETGSADNWELQYGNDPNFTEGSYQTMDQDFNVSGSTITANLTGLTPEQNYYARVKSVCTACNQTSQWSTFSSFKPTNAASFTPANNGGSSLWIPFYINYCDIGTRTQFIIPANRLAQMTDGEITKLTFYAEAAPTISFEGAAFQICMKEVDQTTFDSTFVDWSSLTEVYQGGLTWNGNKCSFEFDESNRFTYHGGNLLVAFTQNSFITYIQYLNFLGAVQSGYTSLYQKANAAHQYNGNQGEPYKFIPKVTFSYFVAEFPGPRSLNFSNPQSDGITATWNAPNENVTEYRYQFSADNGETWSELFSTTTTSVTLTGLPYPEHTYLFRVKASYGENESNFATKTFITEALCPVPQGIVATNITAHTATFNWNMLEGVTYQCAVALDDDTTFTWGDVPAGNTFTGLTAETNYVFHLRRDCTNDNYDYSDETTYAFQTEEACPAPTNVQVTYNGGSTATVTWNGNADAYIIMVNEEEISGNFVISPYTLNVEYATTYTIGVMADCGSEGSSPYTYADIFSTDLCASEDQCTINYTLTDAYGNGWGLNNSFLPHIRIVDVETGFLIENLTMPFECGSSLSGSFDVCNNREIDIIWEPAFSTGYPYECGFLFTDVNGEVICEHQGCLNYGDCQEPAQGTIIRYTVNCTVNECATPVDFQESVSTNNATIYWTDDGNATSWKVYSKKKTDTDYGTPTTVYTKTHTLSNLDPGTEYDILIESGCDQDKFLIGSFITDCEATSLTYEEPLIENFEGWVSATDTCLYNDINGIYPDCWRRYTEGTVNPHIINYGSNCHPHEGTCVMYFINEVGTSSYLSLPTFSNNLNTLFVSFWMQTDHANYGTLSLGYITEGDINFNTFQEIESYNNSTVMVQRNTLLGTHNIPDNATHIVFRWYNGNDVICGTCIDDVTVNIASMVFSGIEGNNWDNPNNWIPANIPTLSDNVFIQSDVTITGEAEARIVALGNGKSLLIADGGTLKTDYDVIATIKKNIVGYGIDNANDNNGYYLIANPIVETIYNHSSSLTPNISSTGLLNDTYDLYRWDYAATDDLEWRNYKDIPFNLFNGESYLYANLNDIELSFVGTVKANNIDQEMNTEYDETQFNFNGWNLLGNPFVCDAYLNDAANGMAFFRMNDNGDDFTVATGPIHPMEGIFVKADNAGQSFKFSRTQIDGNSKGMLSINLSDHSAPRSIGRTQQPKAQGSITDRVIVRFGEGNTLEKLNFRENHTKVYIPINGKDYSVIKADDLGELPINFKAERNGRYTLDFSHNDIDFSYLHLIDHLIGNDVNLLMNPSYSFEAHTTDYASRFQLVFATGSSVHGDSFGFINGSGNLTIFGIEGEAALQVIDINGRILVNETFSRSYEKKIEAVPGVYILRLINSDNVKVQKIVIR